MNPLVSIVIPIHNAKMIIGKCISFLRRQTYLNIEIIVVDNASNDVGDETWRQMADKVLFEPRKGISFAKNSGIRAASGEFIATTDADCEADPAWVEELLKGFSSEKIASVGGKNLDCPGCTPFEEAVGVFLEFLGGLSRSQYIFSSESTCPTSHNPGCTVMYKKSALEDVGFFNEKFFTVEDEELDVRLAKKGYTLMFSPSARVYHRRRSNYAGFFVQMYRYALGRALLYRTWPEKHDFLRDIPALVVLFLASGAVACPFLPSFLPVYAWFFSLFLFFTGGIVLYAVFSRKYFHPLRLFFLLMVFVFSYGSGLIRGIIMPPENF